jgi:hypothetical protein
MVYPSAERSFQLDLESPGFGFLRRQIIKKIPTAIIKVQRTCPIEKGPRTNPSWIFGSQKNSNKTLSLTL